MEFKIKVLKELCFNAKYLDVQAKVSYWEDAIIDGVSDEDGSHTPCRKNDCWVPTIDIDTGVITNWEKGKTASIHFKVYDSGKYSIRDDNGTVQLSQTGYVIDCLCIGDEGYGDYIIMQIDESGKINNWSFNINCFNSEDEMINYFRINLNR